MEKLEIKDKERKKKRVLIIFYRYLFFLIGSVMLVILQSFLGKSSNLPYYFLSILVIFLIVVSVCIGLSYIVYKIICIEHIDILGLEEENKCKFFDTVCCVNIAIESLKSAYQIRLEDSTAIKYGLYTEEQLIAKEGGLDLGEVWIVSYDLTAEALDSQQARVREGNLKKGIKYRMFYINDRTQKYSELRDNIDKLDKRYNRKMKLYPYENPISIYTFLFSLFGIIMFTDQEGRVKEAFFTLYSSNDKIKEPIYMKMSYCMEKKYNKILNSIKVSARNPRAKQKTNRKEIKTKGILKFFKNNF